MTKVEMEKLKTLRNMKTNQIFHAIKFDGSQKMIDKYLNTSNLINDQTGFKYLAYGEHRNPVFKGDYLIRDKNTYRQYIGVLSKEEVENIYEVIN